MRVAVQALLAPSTDLTGEPVRLVNSSSFPACGGAPRWWALDLDVRGQFFDTAVTTETPREGEIDAFAPRAPLHVLLAYDAATPLHNDDFAHTRVIDSIPGLYFIWASSLAVYLLVPPATATFDPLTPAPWATAVRSPSALAARVDAGLTICPAPVEGGRRSALYTHRELLAGAGAERVAIPAGARDLQIYDSGVWAWHGPALAGVPTTGGQSSIVAVPSSLYVGPVAGGVARTAGLVFGVDL